jgi:hypothetical protein
MQNKEKFTVCFSKEKPEDWEDTIQAHVGITWERHKEMFNLVLELFSQYRERGKADFLIGLAETDKLSTIEKLVIVDTLSTLDGRAQFENMLMNIVDKEEVVDHGVMYG